ncbi:uncharacterized protein PRCAT00000169001 [Priceomyces carsonii]|uniref:uncharacterized protein n=1 Tax=Priceomyces carsonii TaxID=28549 RepID=UPI002ED79A8C|nr:unnamed protein product [Priceomyces carsonii]
MPMHARRALPSLARPLKETLCPRKDYFYRSYALKSSSTFKIGRSKSLKQDKYALESPTASNKVFAFGNFSSLQTPTAKGLQLTNNVLQNISSFDSLKIFPTVRAAMIEEIKEGYNLKSTYIKDKSEIELKPSPVQIAAIRKINQSRSRRLSNEKRSEKRQTSIIDELAKNNEQNRLKVFTIAAETGSGKTWAYLAPLLSKLKEQDLESFRTSRKAYEEFKNAPQIRSLILLPTHELVEQVYECVRRASLLPYNLDQIITSSVSKDKDYVEFLNLPENKESLNLSVLKWGSGDPHTKLFNAANNKVDILITTPSKIIGLAKLNNVSHPFKCLSRIEYCVVDEADTLFDKSWIVDTTSVIKKLRGCKDLVFCSATIPKEFKKTMSNMFPDSHSIINIVTPQLHKIPKQIVLKVIDAQLSPYNGSKTRCLAQALYAIYNDGTEKGFVKRILVFVNEKKDVEPLVNVLINKFSFEGGDIIGVTGKDSATDRMAKIEPFLRPAELLDSDEDQSKIKVLVTTDLLARGLNFVGIKNVILMDLPNTSVDLVHRIGRTGRMRQSGRVFVIIDKKTRKSWIKGLPNAIKKGMTLG